MNQCEYKQSQSLRLGLSQIKHITKISEKSEAEVGLEGGEGEGSQQRDPRRREVPTYNGSAQLSTAHRGECPVLRMDASGLLHLLLINHFSKL